MPGKRPLGAILPWYGSKRTMAPLIIRQLGRHQFYFEGCCGSLAVLLAKPPSHHEMACDLHGALTNLCWVLQDGKLSVELFDMLERTMYQDDLYLRSVEELQCMEKNAPSAVWAYHYFVVSWMGRNGIIGTDKVKHSIATRWTSGGGSGPLRFHRAVDSIPAWVDRLKNVHILRRDLFECLASIEDRKEVSMYIDPPYLPETTSSGGRFEYDFTSEQHSRLATALSRFHKARVVVSYYDAPQLNNLYSGWRKIKCPRHKHLHTTERGSAREVAPEVLLVNGFVYAP